MYPNQVKALLSAAAILLIAMLACNLPGNSAPSSQPPIAPQIPAVAPSIGASPAPVVEPTATVAVVHVKLPSSQPGTGSIVYDVESSVTASEKRAPYGDSYDINRLERPFLKDMTYVPDLDIATFHLGQDTDWYYVSVKLVGVDPNNALGINYGVELDTNADGFGDFIIWARPPYTSEWSTDNVQAFADKNHNTSGLTAEKSDAPFTADGYETLIFDGGHGSGDDPDLAWIRMATETDVTLQFAFKKSWAGGSFMYGALADAGLKDVSKLDYVDRFTEEEAGSPIKSKKNYPLQALFAVDNTCREAYGFKPNGYEPMLCPKEPKPTRQPKEPEPLPGVTPGVPPPPAGCPPHSCFGVWHEDGCWCEEWPR
ncbi:MAG: hypothetical protein MUO77_03820 [Anaerolineales bacterium]|nr:hypothetical protein [Anaerolineales bacterium]